MQLGMVGLGRMGANMIRRVMRAGHEGVVFDRDPAAVAELAGEGAVPSESLADLVAKLTAPRTIWIMVPAGAPTEGTVAELAEHLEPGDVVVDGGNSFYKDDVRRSKELAERGIHYVDVGTSGGVWGLERGYCLMVGGNDTAFRQLEPVLVALAPGIGEIERTRGRSGDSTTTEMGYLHCGPCGAGHYVKMVHNGIEYGLMQAYAEGLDILRNADHDDVEPDLRFDLDVAEITELWRRGSVVGSWLLDLTAAALHEDPDLTEYSGHVSDSGEGRWTVEAAVNQAVPVYVLAAALFARFRSRQEHTYADKVLSAMRRGFGGHIETPGTAPPKPAPEPDRPVA